MRSGKKGSSGSGGDDRKRKGGTSRNVDKRAIADETPVNEVEAVVPSCPSPVTPEENE